jgi:NAD(P)-dependent dehydrogenase (short-subunit alcohol dehydrogenase family)
MVGMGDSSQLSGRAALVTGAGSGIGKASALLLAREGAAVAALSRSESEVRALAAQINESGGAALPLVADVSRVEQVREAVAQATRHFGRLDIVFANAGVNGVWAPIEDLTSEEWDQTIDINLKGTFLTIKYAVPALKERGGSVIVNASVNGTRMFSNSGATAYSVSKAGQLAMAQMLAVELARHNIRVNVICPGATITELGQNTEIRDIKKLSYGPRPGIPMGRAASADEIAQLVLFLASDRSRYITGTPIWIDGGLSLVQG